MQVNRDIDPFSHRLSRQINIHRPRRHVPLICMESILEETNPDKRKDLILYLKEAALNELSEFYMIQFYPGNDLAGGKQLLLEIFGEYMAKGIFTLSFSQTDGLNLFQLTPNSWWHKCNRPLDAYIEDSFLNHS